MENSVPQPSTYHNLPPESYTVTPLAPANPSHTHWKKVLLLISFIMLFVGLNIGAYVLATKKNIKTDTTPTTQQTPLPGGYEPPATINKPPEVQTVEWKEYKTDYFSVKYPPEWETQPDTSVEHGIKLYNPDTIRNTITTASNSATQYIILSYHEASESAQQYVDKIQLNCCIGPSAIPGAESRFKKQQLVVNGFDAVGYNPVTDIFAGWNYVFATGRYIIEAFTTAPTSTGNSIENRIISTFTLTK